MPWKWGADEWACFAELEAHEAVGLVNDIDHLSPAAEKLTPPPPSSSGSMRSCWLLAFIRTGRDCLLYPLHERYILLLAEC